MDRWTVSGSVRRTSSCVGIGHTVFPLAGGATESLTVWIKVTRTTVTRVTLQNLFLSSTFLVALHGIKKVNDEIKLCLSIYLSIYHYVILFLSLHHYN